MNERYSLGDRNICFCLKCHLNTSDVVSTGLAKEIYECWLVAKDIIL